MRKTTTTTTEFVPRGSITTRSIASRGSMASRGSITSTILSGPVNLDDDALRERRERALEKEEEEFDPWCDNDLCCDRSDVPSMCVLGFIHLLIIVPAILALVKPMGQQMEWIHTYMMGFWTFLWLLYVGGEVLFALVSSIRGINPLTKNCMVVSFLLVIEGVLILMPVFLSLDTMNELGNDDLFNVFPVITMNDPPDAFETPFHFGSYMLPGGFSPHGKYTTYPVPEYTEVYKEDCKPACELDVHLPPSFKEDETNTYPVIFHIHGEDDTGDPWMSGDKTEVGTAVDYWLERGYAFVSVNYRFPSILQQDRTKKGQSIITPDDENETTIFDIMDDIEDAYNFIVDNRDDLSLNTDFTLYSGDSAGGHLACLIAQRSQNPYIRGVFNLYGITEWDYYMRNGGDDKLGGDLEQSIEVLLPTAAKSSEDVKNRYLEEASCSNYLPEEGTPVTNTTPPVLTVHGTWDTTVPVEMSMQLHTKFNNLEVANLLVEVPLSGHALDRGWLSIGGQFTRYAFERFLAKTISLN